MSGAPVCLTCNERMLECTVEERITNYCYWCRAKRNQYPPVAYQLKQALQNLRTPRPLPPLPPPRNFHAMIISQLQKLKKTSLMTNLARELALCKLKPVMNRTIARNHCVLVNDGISLVEIDRQKLVGNALSGISRKRNLVWRLLHEDIRDKKYELRDTITTVSVNQCVFVGEKECQMGLAGCSSAYCEKRALVELVKLQPQKLVPAHLAEAVVQRRFGAWWNVHYAISEGKYTLHNNGPLTVHRNHCVLWAPGCMDFDCRKKCCWDKYLSLVEIEGQKVVKVPEVKVSEAKKPEVKKAPAMEFHPNWSFSRVAIQDPVFLSEIPKADKAAEREKKLLQAIPANVDSMEVRNITLELLAYSDAAVKEERAKSQRKLRLDVLKRDKEAVFDRCADLAKMYAVAQEKLQKLDELIAMAKEC